VRIELSALRNNNLAIHAPRDIRILSPNTAYCSVIKTCDIPRDLTGIDGEERLLRLVELGKVSRLKLNRNFRRDKMSRSNSAVEILHRFLFSVPLRSVLSIDTINWLIITSASFIASRIDARKTTRLAPLERHARDFDARSFARYCSSSLSLTRCPRDDIQARGNVKRAFSPSLAIYFPSARPRERNRARLIHRVDREGRGANETHTVDFSVQ